VATESGVRTADAPPRRAGAGLAGPGALVPGAAGGQPASFEALVSALRAALARPANGGEALPADGKALPPELADALRAAVDGTPLAGADRQQLLAAVRALLRAGGANQPPAQADRAADGGGAPVASVSADSATAPARGPLGARPGNAGVPVIRPGVSAGDLESMAGLLLRAADPAGPGPQATSAPTGGAGGAQALAEALERSGAASWHVGGGTSRSGSEGVLFPADPSLGIGATARGATASGAPVPGAPAGLPGSASMPGMAAATAFPPLALSTTPGQTQESGIAQRLLWMTSNRLDQAEFRMNPPQLGPLGVRLRFDGDQANVVFHASHAQVRDAIEASLPRLRDLLAEQGIQLGQASVDSGEAGSRGEGGAQRRASGEPGAAPAHGGGAPASANAGDDARRDWVPRGLLDTYA
jgi:flagellar hook-length control protein FliK